MSSDEALLSQLSASPPASLVRLVDEHSARIAAWPPARKAAAIRAMHARCAGMSFTNMTLASMSPVSGGGSNQPRPESVVILRLFLCTHGLELTHLKNALDISERALHLDMTQLLALLSPPMRDNLLRHVRAEAEVALTELNPSMASAAAGSRRRSRSSSDGSDAPAPFWWPLKAYADFDDTMQVRVYDHSFPTGAYYPGVRALLTVLQSHRPVPPHEDDLAIAAWLKRMQHHSARTEEEAVAVIELTAMRTRSDSPPHTQIDAPQSVAAVTGSGDDGAHSARSAPAGSVVRSAGLPSTTAATPRGVTRSSSLRNDIGYADAVAFAAQGRTGSTPRAPVVITSPKSHGSLATLAAEVTLLSLEQSSPAGTGVAIGMPMNVSFPVKARSGRSSPSEMTDGIVLDDSSDLIPPAPVADSIDPQPLPSPAAHSTEDTLSPPSSAGRVSRKPSDTIVSSPATRSGSTSPTMHAARIISSPPPVPTTHSHASSPPLPDMPAPVHQISGVVYISARPAFMRGTTLAAARTMGVAPHAILYGTLASAVTKTRMAERKLLNYLTYHELFPEYRVVWIGDSGQGDMLFGERLLTVYDDAQSRKATAASSHVALASDGSREDGVDGTGPMHAHRGHLSRGGSAPSSTASALVTPVKQTPSPAQTDGTPVMSTPASAAVAPTPATVAALGSKLRDAAIAPGMRVVPPQPLVLIHDICSSDQRPITSAAARGVLRGKGVHVFDSYVSAALICYDHGLLTAAELFTVCDAALDDIRDMRFVSQLQMTQRTHELMEAHRAVQLRFLSGPARRRETSRRSSLHS